MDKLIVKQVMFIPGEFEDGEAYWSCQIEFENDRRMAVALPRKEVPDLVVVDQLLGTAMARAMKWERKLQEIKDGNPDT